MGVINYILGLGPSVMMPIIVFILALVFRISVGRALRAALTIGVGFVAINLVIGLLETLSPATEAMVENLGLRLDVMDVGWPVAAAISFGTTAVVPWVFALGILLNIALIGVNFTRTLNIDMWNYWHFIFGAAFVYAITGSLVLGIVIALLTMVIVLKLADMTAPVVQKFFGLPGVSLPHTETVSWAPVGWVLDRTIDRIPRVRDIHIDPGTIQQRFGVFGEPLLVGVVLGGMIGLLGFGPDLAEDFGGALQQILTTAIGLGAVMLVLPRMVRILMEGLIPVSEGARDFINSRFPGRQLHIGLDAAVVIGHPANMATGLLMVPITLALALGLALIGVNRMLPFTDLAVLPFLVIWAVAWGRGNIFRGVINASIFMVGILTIGTFLAPATTDLARAAQFDIPEGTLLISSLDVGAHVSSWLLALPFMTADLTASGTGVLVSSLILAPVVVLCYVIFFLKRGAWDPEPADGPGKDKAPSEAKPAPEKAGAR
jgi:galactitol PTS system EIIC component